MCDIKIIFQYNFAKEGVGILTKQNQVFIETTKTNSDTNSSSQRDNEYLSKDLSINKASLISYLRS